MRDAHAEILFTTMANLGKSNSQGRNATIPFTCCTIETLGRVSREVSMEVRISGVVAVTGTRLLWYLIVTGQTLPPSHSHPNKVK